MAKKTQTINLTKTHPHTKITIHKGGLHHSLGIPEGQKIPEKRLEAATHSSNPKTRKQANLAKTMKGWHH